MLNKKLLYLLSVCLVMLCFSLELTAQVTTFSPYSRFGIGNIQKNGFVQNAGMGGVGFALRSPGYINITNPASYTDFKPQSFVFETGMLNNTIRLNSNDTNQITNNTSMAYLSFGFPVTRWWGSSFGLRPYSNVGYKISDNEVIDNIGSVNYLFDGSGGVNQFYIGNAFKLKNLSMGVNVSYLFGPLENSKIEVFDSTNIYDYYVGESTKIGDFSFDFGMQYSVSFDTLFKKELNEKITITAGVVLGLETRLRAEKSVISETIFEGFIKDTIASETINGEITLPAGIGFGLSIKKGERWFFEVDYHQEDWSDFSMFGESDSLTINRNFAFGAQYLPKKVSTGGFWSRTRYRLGGYYTETYLRLNNIQLKEYGMSFGVGLPLKRSKSTINLSVGMGRRGTTDKNLIKEDFIKIIVGFSLYDNWFMKRKFD